MLILISDAFDASLEGKLKAFGDVTTDKTKACDADVILVRAKTICDKAYIDGLKNCKLIIRGGVGIDNIDKAYAESKGIIVKNTPKASSIAVAELTFALMLSAPNHIVEYHNGLKNGQWLKTIKRTELYGKTLGLLGIGNIATKVAERAKAFGMNVVAYDKYVSSSAVATLVPSVEEAVKDADYISIHMPLTDETKGMFNASLFAKMNKHPVIINAARGNIVDADAMVKALEDGSVSWYCADVYPSDPPAEDYPILKAEHVTLTPHVGANSVENLLRIGDEICETLKVLKTEGKI
ncbi:MAG: NAD(P)-binding domain-containing protein [Sphaerochaetaceae bacterium]|nr:NAD(P)-binding domain-containing protein [Sphaerochaetaceae bacterium]